MLVLSRKVGEKIVIDGRITVVITEIKGNAVRIGVSAPPEILVDRGEVHARRAEFADVVPVHATVCAARSK